MSTNLEILILEVPFLKKVDFSNTEFNFTSDSSYSIMDDNTQETKKTEEKKNKENEIIDFSNAKFLGGVIFDDSNLFKLDYDFSNIDFKKDVSFKRIEFSKDINF